MKYDHLYDQYFPLKHSCMFRVIWTYEVFARQIWGLCTNDTVKNEMMNETRNSSEKNDTET